MLFLQSPWRFFVILLSVQFAPAYVFGQKRRSKVKSAFLFFISNLFLVATFDFLLRLNFAPPVLRIWSWS